MSKNPQNDLLDEVMDFVEGNFRAGKLPGLMGSIVCGYVDDKQIEYNQLQTILNENPCTWKNQKMSFETINIVFYDGTKLTISLNQQPAMQIIPKETKND